MNTSNQTVPLLIKGQQTREAAVLERVTHEVSHTLETAPLAFTASEINNIRFLYYLSGVGLVPVASGLVIVEQISVAGLPVLPAPLPLLLAFPLAIPRFAQVGQQVQVTFKLLESARRVQAYLELTAINPYETFVQSLIFPNRTTSNTP